jgi:hypothetical protein
LQSKPGEKAAGYLLLAGFFFVLLFKPLKKEATCSSETLVDFSMDYMVLSRETELFISTAVRTSNSTLARVPVKICSYCPPPPPGVGTTTQNSQ